MEWIATIPGGLWTLVVVALVIILLPRLIRYLRFRRPARTVDPWEKHADVDRSEWGKDQWEE